MVLIPPRTKTPKHMWHHTTINLVISKRLGISLSFMMEFGTVISQQMQLQLREKTPPRFIRSISVPLQHSMKLKISGNSTVTLIDLSKAIRFKSSRISQKQRGHFLLLLCQLVPSPKIVSTKLTHSEDNT